MNRERNESNASAATERFADLVRATNWDELTARLLAFASYSLARVPGHGAGHRTPHDYVVRAVMDVLENSELYEKSGQSSMFDVIASVIAQLIRADESRSADKHRG